MLRQTILDVNKFVSKCIVEIKMYHHTWQLSPTEQLIHYKTKCRQLFLFHTQNYSRYIMEKPGNNVMLFYIYLAQTCAQLQKKNVIEIVCLCHLSSKYLKKLCRFKLKQRNKQKLCIFKYHLEIFIETLIEGKRIHQTNIYINCNKQKPYTKRVNYFTASCTHNVFPR